MRLILATLLALAGAVQATSPCIGPCNGSPEGRLATATKNHNVGITRGGASVVGSTSGSAAGAAHLNLNLPGLNRSAKLQSGVTGSDSFASSSNGRVVNKRRVDSAAVVGIEGVRTGNRQNLSGLTAGNAKASGIGSAAASGILKQVARGLAIGPNGRGTAATDSTTSAASSLTAKNANKGRSLTNFQQNSNQAAQFNHPTIGGGPVVLPLVPSLPSGGNLPVPSLPSGGKLPVPNW